MLNQVEAARDRWGGRSSTIDNWLQARQTLLIQYCHLAGIDTPESGCLPDADTISEFCTLLMDYLSAGHFEVYELLVENDEKGVALKQQTYPKIAATTDSALNFNDTYADNEQNADIKHFDQALAKLGETLAERFELEDELIQHMHQRLEQTESVIES